MSISDDSQAINSGQTPPATPRMITSPRLLQTSKNLRGISYIQINRGLDSLAVDHRLFNSPLSHILSSALPEAIAYTGSSLERKRVEGGMRVNTKPAEAIVAERSHVIHSPITHLH